MKKLIYLIVIASLLGACSGTTPAAPTATPTESALIESTATATATSGPAALSLWVAPAVPDSLRAAASASDILLVDEPQLATITLSTADSGSDWIYALVAPFPTVIDGVTSKDLLSAWKGVPAGSFAGRALLMAEST